MDTIPTLPSIPCHRVDLPHLVASGNHSEVRSRLLNGITSQSELDDALVVAAAGTLKRKMRVEAFEGLGVNVCEIPGDVFEGEPEAYRQICLSQILAGSKPLRPDHMQFLSEYAHFNGLNQPMRDTIAQIQTLTTIISNDFPDYPKITNTVAPPQSYTDKGLHEAVQTDNFDLAADHLIHGISPNGTANSVVSPLFLAVARGNDKLARLLLIAGADPFAYTGLLLYSDPKMACRLPVGFLAPNDRLKTLLVTVGNFLRPVSFVMMHSTITQPSGLVALAGNRRYQPTKKLLIENTQAMIQIDRTNRFTNETVRAIIKAIPKVKQLS